MFMSFSNVFFNGSTIINDQVSDISTIEADLNDIQGQFFYLSLQVKLVIQSSRLQYGYAKTGGAIYLNGLSELYVYDSQILNNEAL